MKKYFPIILIVILALSIMQHRKKKGTNFNKLDYQQIEEDAINKESETSEYIDKSGGYGLIYPASWELSDSAYKNEMIRADIFKGNEIGFQVRLYQNTNLSFKKFVTNGLDQFESDMSNRWNGEMKLEKKNFVEGRENVYYRVIYQQIKDDGEAWTYLEYIWNLNDQVLWFQAGFNRAKVANGIDQLDEIAESVKLFN